MSDEDLFAKEMGKVAPLKEDKIRITSALTKTIGSKKKQAQQKHKILMAVAENNDGTPLATHAANIAPQRSEPFLLRADGVASKDIKKLAQSKITYEIDLHGLTQAQAEHALNDFFTQALEEEVRQVCIVHGRGNHSKGKSVLKDTTYHWFESGTFSSFILAASPAVQSKGGACNVLLRKQKL